MATLTTEDQIPMEKGKKERTSENWLKKKCSYKIISEDCLEDRISPKRKAWPDIPADIRTLTRTSRPDIQTKPLSKELRAAFSCLIFADWNLSSTELESGNAPGAFLQTQTQYWIESLDPWVQDFYPVAAVHHPHRESATPPSTRTGYKSVFQIRFGFESVRNNRKGGTASLRSCTCVKRNAVFGARFKGLSLYFLKRTWIHILRGSKRHLPKGRSWFLLEFHLNFRNFTRILLEFYWSFTFPPVPFGRLDTYLIRIQTRTPLSRYPPYDYSKQCSWKASESRSRITFLRESFGMLALAIWPVIRLRGLCCSLRSLVAPSAQKIIHAG